MPNIVDDLLFIADAYARNDPIGAATLRRAARIIAGAQEVPCKNCQTRYAEGYRVGYRKGLLEWQEGLPDPPAPVAPQKEGK